MHFGFISHRGVSLPVSGPSDAELGSELGSGLQSCNSKLKRGQACNLAILKRGQACNLAIFNCQIASLTPFDPNFDPNLPQSKPDPIFDPFCQIASLTPF